MCWGSAAMAACRLTDWLTEHGLHVSKSAHTCKIKFFNFDTLCSECADVSHVWLHESWYQPDLVCNFIEQLTGKEIICFTTHLQTISHSVSGSQLQLLKLNAAVPGTVLISAQRRSFRHRFNFSQDKTMWFIFFFFWTNLYRDNNKKGLLFVWSTNVKQQGSFI